MTKKREITLFEQEAGLYHSKYRYLNANPKSKLTDDCVIRAISFALHKTWDEVYLALSQLAFDMKLVSGDERVYAKYLAQNGWVKQKQPRKPDGGKYTIKEYLGKFKGTAVIHAGNYHMSFISDGWVYDVFNCEDRIIGCYWVKKT